MFKDEGVVSGFVCDICWYATLLIFRALGQLWCHAATCCCHTQWKYVGPKPLCKNVCSKINSMPLVQLVLSLFVLV